MPTHHRLLSQLQSAASMDGHTERKKAAVGIALTEQGYSFLLQEFPHQGTPHASSCFMKHKENVPEVPLLLLRLVIIRTLNRNLIPVYSRI